MLLTTGYAEDVARAYDMQSESLKVLRKPYRQAELAMALARSSTWRPAMPDEANRVWPFADTLIYINARAFGHVLSIGQERI